LWVLAGIVSSLANPRTGVLGHSQPSLAGLFLIVIPTQDWRPGLASWATLSRPFGTQFVSEVLTYGLHPNPGSRPFETSFAPSSLSEESNLR